MAERVFCQRTALQEAELSSDVILPNWIGNNAKRGVEGLIPDKEFRGLEFLVQNGIITV